MKANYQNILQAGWQTLKHRTPGPLLNALTQARQSKQEQELLNLAQLTQEELTRNFQSIAQGAAQAAAGRFTAPPKTILWFIPQIQSVLRGGVRTIFTFAEHFSASWNTQNIFVVDLRIGTLTAQQRQEFGLALKQNFPRLHFELIFLEGPDPDLNSLPAAEIAFCTLWTTAYLLARYNGTGHKFYFMQDYEPLFYPAGSISGVIEATYRLGFNCLANTVGVAEKYLAYSKPERVTHFTPGVDKTTFYPAKQKATEAAQRIVFYGRPHNQRNGFQLGLEALKQVKAQLGTQVEILSAGANWNPADFGAQGVLTNLGTLNSLEAVANLYRSCDLGLVFMFTPHPSYQPLEYMASGCVTVTNINPGTSWLLQDDVNALLVEPIPGLIAEKIIAALADPARLTRLRAAGLKTSAALSWDIAFQVGSQFILSHLNLIAAEQNHHE